MLDKLIRWSTRYMAVGVMIAGFLGILFPAAMKPYARFIPTLLGIIMFGMGMTMSASDFRRGHPAVYHHAPFGLCPCYALGPAS